MPIFLAIVLTLLGLFHWFLYARFVSALDITAPEILWPLRILAIFLALSYILTRITERSLPEFLATAMEWLSSVWLGLMWELLWMTLVLLLCKVVLVLSGAWTKFDPQTLTLIGRTSVIATLSAAILLCSYGMTKALGPVRVAMMRVPMKNITDEQRKLRIVMASDIHVGELLGHTQIRRLVSQINAQNPDVILLPGDLVDRGFAEIMPFAEDFRALQATYGVFGSTGNHEYYVGLKNAQAWCEAAGIKLLMNEAVELPGNVVIAGIEDRTAKQMGRARPDVADFVRSLPEGKTKILLNHSPYNNETAAASEAGADLVLAGHAHGGQVWPFSLFSGMAYKYHWGLYKMPKGYIYTSSGAGFWGPPMRIGAPPELGLIQLVGEHEPSSFLYE